MHLPRRTTAALSALLSLSLAAAHAEVIWASGADDGSTDDFEAEANTEAMRNYHFDPGDYSRLARHAPGAGVWTGGREPLSTGIPNNGDPGMPRAVTTLSSDIRFLFNLGSAALAPDSRYRYSTRAFLPRAVGTQISTHDLAIILNGRTLLRADAVTVQTLVVEFSAAEAGLLPGENVLVLRRLGGTLPWPTDGSSGTPNNPTAASLRFDFHRLERLTPGSTLSARLPVALTLQSGPPSYRLTWPTSFGSAYQIERSADLLNWTSLTTAWPSGGATAPLLAYDTPRQGPRDFFRIRPLPRRDPRPDILLIIADDLRDHTAFPGRNPFPLPNLERLAARSVRFDRAYCQYPVCGPSRASLLTGQRPSTTGLLDNNQSFRAVLPDIVTLPQLLRQNGYFAASLGKVFHGANARTAADPVSWDDDRHTNTFPVTPLGNGGYGRNVTNGALPWTVWRAATGGDLDQPDGQLVSAAVDLLGTPRDQPLFLAVGINKPHDPFVAPAPYFDALPFNSILLNNDPANATPAPTPAIPAGASLDAFRAMTAQDRREFTRAYLACIAYADAQLGRLLDALDHRGRWDNTIVIFTSDHGYHLGEREWWSKVTLFERCARTPLLISIPGLTHAGARTTGIAELLDLYPTLVELADVPLPSHALEGRSLVPQLVAPAAPGKPAALTQVVRSGYSGFSLRTPTHRYTEWDNGTRGVELYDHTQDPGEWRNLAQDPAQAALRTELSAQLARLVPTP